MEIHKKTFRPAFLAFILLVILSACATSLQTSWDDPYYKGKRFNTLIILELSEQPEIRNVFESTTAAYFDKKGLKAIPSYTKMKSDTSFKYYQFEMKFDSLGVDAILVFRMLGTEEKETFVPDPGFVFPQYYFNYYTYYLNNYNMIHAPGYIRTDKVVKMEVSLYSNKGDMLVWTAHSSTFALDSTEEIAKSLAKKVYRELKHKKLI